MYTSASCSNISKPKNEIGIDKYFVADKPSEPTLSVPSCMDLRLDDDLFNPRLVRQNGERLNAVLKAMDDSRKFAHERLHNQTRLYLEAKKQIRNAQTELFRRSELLRILEHSYCNVLQKLNTERNEFAISKKELDAEKEVLLNQNKSLNSEIQASRDENIDLHFEYKSLLSKKQELTNMLLNEQNRVRELVETIENIKRNATAMQNISRKQESAQNTFTQMHEEISYANDLTMITKYGGQNEKAIDCPVTSSVISSTLMTNDMSELMTADNTEYLTTFGQQQTINTPNFFASQHSETDEISNLFRMKMSIFENTNINKECMCANNNASKKRVLSFQEFFRKIKMGFGSTSSSSSIKRTGDSKETNDIIPRVMDDNAKIVKTNRQPKLLMFKKIF